MDSSVQPIAPERESIPRWWRSLFNTSHDAQIVCRANGTALHVNPKAAQLFQLEAGGDEFSLYEILPQTVNSKIRRILQHHSTRPEAIHSINVTAGGGQMLMDLEIVSLDEDFSLVIFKDATRRLRLESHVQRLVTAIDATPDVFLVADAQLKITYVNPAFQSATGYGIEEVIGRADDFLRAPSEHEKIRAYLEQVKNGREWIGELTNVRRSGETYQVESTISPIFDMAGNFIGYVVSERDVTVRKQLQDALRTERDFVQSILHSLDGAIYSLDCNFLLTHANAGWKHLPSEHGGIRLSGAPEIGRPLLDYVPDAARKKELLSLFQEVLTSGKAQLNHFQADDGYYWAVKISPWLVGSRMHGLICSIEDQTSNHELQNQLFQSQKLEIIGTLAAGVAHDFNNLLQVIIGHTNLIQMQMGAEPSPMRQSLERVNMAALRAREITQQLLSFSRADEEKQIILDLNKVIKETGKLVRCTLQQNISLEIRSAEEPVPIKIDPTRASQALLNLCVNSQDAMSNGGELTMVNAIVPLPKEIAANHNVLADEMYARCSISDTGGGIAPHLLPQIFKPFFTTKQAGKGTGLGLPIVQRVVQEASGFIEIDSVMGKGTTFHLYFPLARESITSVEHQKQVPLAQGKGHLLIVDDIDLIRDFTRNFLQMAGFTVLTAGSGREALEVLEKTTEPIDLLLTDYSMPGMNGFHLIEKVSERWPKIKFILMTAYVDEMTQANVKHRDVSLILKPYAIHDVIKLIMEKITAG